MKLFKTYLPFYKRNLKIAIPIMLSQAGQVLVQQADNMMVGAIGSTELAACAFANSVFLIVMVLGMGFTFSITPIVGHAFGTNNYTKTASLLLNSFLANSVLVIMLSFVMYLVSFLMPYMDQPEEVCNLAIGYYRILVISMIPFQLFYVFKQFCEGLGNTIYAMLITLAVNIINIGFNYVLIYGKCGFPELGLDGAGYATLIARIMMPILFLIIFFRIPKFKEYTFIAIKSKINTEEIINIIKVGFPISMQMILEVSAFSISAIMVGWIGTTELAAHQIAVWLGGMVYMIATGLGSAATIRVAHQYSKQDYLEMKRAAFASLHMVFAFMGTTACLFLIFRNLLPVLYSNEHEVIILASHLVAMAAMFQLFDGLQLVMMGVLRGLADVNHAMIYAFISYIIINIPLAYFLAFKLNLGILAPN
ncbi:MAG: MATE family efflux transporter [Marinifilaceae bacterium]|jgi:MATE family multidrug resistance protein|nr:MATE family efflux transporter [Marinifilaceae bacterium]